tara:strand:+ start:640 stop:939 length:300 start_codon:yes stop_codon:yes gene_type:complete
MPNLVEPGVKYFLNNTLKNTNIKRIKHENFMFNIYLFLGFFVILGIFLYYKFKTKPSQKDLEKREKEKKYYILSKIKSLNEKKQKESQQLITNLPSLNL